MDGGHQRGTEGMGMGWRVGMRGGQMGMERMGP